MRSSSFVVVGALALSCATAKVAKVEAPQATAQDYFCLTQGSTWKYEVELLGAKKVTEVKMGALNADGYAEDSMGGAFMVDAYGVRDRKRYLLRNPVTQGTNWTNVVSVSSVERYEIVSAGLPCQTKAGSWADCVQVESRNRVHEGQELVNRYTLAHGVGIVELATSLESNGGQQLPQSKLELLDFVAPATH